MQKALTPGRVRSAEKHLSKSCFVMNELISQHGPCTIGSLKQDPFKTLVTSIIGQQLSAKAAHTIEKRVLGTVNQFAPNRFLSVTIDTLRACGLSRAKASYIIEMAHKVSSGEFQFELLENLADEDAIDCLVGLPGVGRWTAEMFLMFNLRRPNILSAGDAGLQRSVRLLFGEGHDLRDVAPNWHPYCSVASWYLWRHLDA